MIDTSKPLRTSRVEVSRFTSDTEPSNGTEWMNTKAFSPGLARMSSKIFSSVLYRESTPASPRGEPMVIGMKPPDGWNRLRKRPGLAARSAGTRTKRALGLGPRHAVAARQPSHDGRTDRPGHRLVGGNVHPEPEHLGAARPPRWGHAVLGRHLLLRRDHQVVLGRGAQPAGERHLRTPVRPAGSAPPARSARSARRSAASRRSPWWRIR